jgi:hypothetical protein
MADAAPLKLYVRKLEEKLATQSGPTTNQPAL